MPQDGKGTQDSLSLLVGAILTWTAGFVDAVGFLRVGHIYTANMSGNSVALGIGVAQLQAYEASRRFWPILVYVAGIFACRLLIEIGARNSFTRIASVAFGMEIALLLPASVPAFQTSTGGLLPFELVALLALAMGVQNGALTHFSSLTLHTGFVTGTLVTMAEQLMRFLTWVYDQIRSGATGRAGIWRQAWRQITLKRGVFLGLVWCMYVFGAMMGAVAQARWSLRSLLIAMAILSGMIALDLYKPLAIKEEQAQASAA